MAHHHNHLEFYLILDLQIFGFNQLNVPYAVCKMNFSYLCSSITFFFILGSNNLYDAEKSSTYYQNGGIFTIYYGGREITGHLSQETVQASQHTEHDDVIKFIIIIFRYREYK